MSSFRPINNDSYPLTPSKYDVEMDIGGAVMIYEDARRRLGGEILGYIGFFLCLSTIHGKFNIRCSAATFLFIAAVALNVIGKFLPPATCSPSYSKPSQLCVISAHLMCSMLIDTHRHSHSVESPRH